MAPLTPNALHNEYDDTSSLSSAQDYPTPNYNTNNNMDDHNFQHPYPTSSNHPSAPGTPSPLAQLSDSIQETHNRLVNGSRYGNQNSNVNGFSSPASQDVQGSHIASPYQPSLHQRRHANLAPLNPNPAQQPLLPASPIPGISPSQSPSVVDGQANLFPTTNEPGSLLTRRWEVPPRAKPGRKPATDVPTTKRREQNRIAQRNYRERGKIAAANFELDKVELKAKYEDDANKLRRSLNQHMQENHTLRLQNEAYRKSFGDISAARHAADAQVSKLDRELMELRAKYRALKGHAGNGRSLQSPAAFDGYLQTQDTNGANVGRHHRHRVSDVSAGTAMSASQRCLNCNDLQQACACLEDTQRRQMGDLDLGLNLGSSRRASNVAGMLPSPPYTNGNFFYPQPQQMTSFSRQNTAGSHTGFGDALIQPQPIHNFNQQHRTASNQDGGDRPNLSRLDTNGTNFSEMEIDLTNTGRAPVSTDPDLPSATIPDKEDCGFCTDGFLGPGGIDCLCRAAQDTSAAQQQGISLDAVPLKRKPSSSIPLANGTSHKKPTSSTTPDIENSSSPPPPKEPGTCTQCQKDPSSALFCIEASKRGKKAQPSLKEPNGEGPSPTSSSSLPAAPPLITIEQPQSCDTIYRKLNQHPKFNAANKEAQDCLEHLKTAPSMDPGYAQVVDAASVLCCFKALDNMTEEDWHGVVGEKNGGGGDGSG